MKPTSHIPMPLLTMYWGLAKRQYATGTHETRALLFNLDDGEYVFFAKKSTNGIRCLEVHESSRDPETAREMLDSHELMEWLAAEIASRLEDALHSPDTGRLSPPTH